VPGQATLQCLSQCWKLKEEEDEVEEVPDPEPLTNILFGTARIIIFWFRVCSYEDSCGDGGSSTLQVVNDGSSIGWTSLHQGRQHVSCQK
jgi:hypothetical protein